jgi:hypothetical protein
MRLPDISRAARIECLIAASIFTVAACGSMVYVSTWGQTADILQTSYGPSVMLGCGRGFVNPRAADVPELVAFLQPDLHRDGPPLIDAFDCALIPEDLATVPFTGIHKRTWHLFYVAGWVWWLFGVAWSALTPLYGVLFGLSAVAAYGLFRLLLNPPIALFCTTLFLISPIQLHYLPRLRDFAKAPFMLFALFCLILLLVRPAGWKRALWTGAAAGAAIGLATGFRAEAVMYLILFIPAVLLFYPGWRWPAWGPRVAAIAAFLLCFMAASWPVLMKFQTYGERTHPFLMGFAHFYDGRLGVDQSDYQLAHTDLDTEALALLNAHNRYLDDAAKPIIYETEGYEAVGDDYFFRNLLWVFPADLATRTAAAALRILDELRPNRDAYMPRGIDNPFLEPVYRARVWLMDTLFSRTRYVALGLLLLLGTASPRLGFLALYLTFCLAGMASVQFATRHYFHLEVFPLLAGGLLLLLAWWGCTGLRGLTDRGKFADARRRILDRTVLTRLVTQAAIFVTVAATLVLLPFYGLRWHQDRQLASVFSAYAAAEQETVWPVVASFETGAAAPYVRLACDPVTMPEGLPDAGPEGFFQVDVLVVEVATGEQAVRLQFRYAGDRPDRNLTWKADVGVGTDSGDTVKFYAPIFNAVWPDTPDNATWGDLPATWTRFDGIEIAASDLPRIRGMKRFRYGDAYTPLVAVSLGASKDGPWYQRFSR